MTKKLNQYLLRLRVDISHHQVEPSLTPLPDVLQCIDMAVVYIQVGVG
jgi:hypothetical protein